MVKQRRLDARLFWTAGEAEQRSVFAAVVMGSTSFYFCPQFTGFGF